MKILLPKVFLGKEHNELNTILMAGSYAPNGMGLQTWRFTVIHNPGMMQKISEGLRQQRMRAPNFYLMLLPMFWSLMKRATAMRWLSALAIGTMMLAAHSLGIGSCWLNQLPQLSILEVPEIRQLLGELAVPEDHLVYDSFVLGYPAEEPKPVNPAKM